MKNAIFAETSSAKRRAIEAAAPEFDALRETLRHTGEVFQVSPKAVVVRALKLKLLTRDLPTKPAGPTPHRRQGSNKARYQWPVPGFTLRFGEGIASRMLFV